MDQTTSQPVPANRVSPSLLADKEARALTSDQIVERLTGLHSTFEEIRTLAISTATAALLHGVAMGQLLTVAFGRFEGEFEKWLETTVLDPEGKPLMSDLTARKYRRLFEKRDSIFPPDDSMPQCRTLTDAYIKTELLPDRPEGAETMPQPIPFFRLNFVHSDIDPGEWPAEKRAEFMSKTAPIAEMRDKVLALQAA